jgi:hypothetical protein
MGKTSSSAKAAWNASHYAQVKVSVDPGLAVAFKAACAKDGVSMAKDLSGYMRRRTQTHLPETCATVRVATRKDRRATVDRLIGQLKSVIAAEEAYKDNIPENLVSSRRYDDAEAALSGLEEAIELLLEAY